MGDAEIGVAAAGNERSHSLAQAVKRGVRPERRHLAGDFEAEHIGYAGRRRVISLALVDVGPIDARGFDPNENLPRPRVGARARLDLQRLRTAGAGRDNDAHALSLVSHVNLSPASAAAVTRAAGPISSIADRGGRRPILRRRGAKRRKRLGAGGERSQIQIAAGIDQIGQNAFGKAESADH